MHLAKKWSQERVHGRWVVGDNLLRSVRKRLTFAAGDHMSRCDVHVEHRLGVTFGDVCTFEYGARGARLRVDHSPAKEEKEVEPSSKIHKQEARPHQFNMRTAHRDIHELDLSKSSLSLTWFAAEWKFRNLCDHSKVSSVYFDNGISCSQNLDSNKQYVV